MISSYIASILAVATLAAARPSPRSANRSEPWPARYNNSSTGGTWLYGAENGGQLLQVPIQALGGKLIFSEQHPDRVCPCSDAYGTKNWTAYYGGGTTEAPTLQLFTSSAGEQQVYVDRDLSLRYTAPGVPIPPGANATSITSVNEEPLGDGLPSTGTLVFSGHVTQANGTVTTYNSCIFCAPKNASADAINGPGPLEVFASTYIGADTVYPENCGPGAIFTSINDPSVTYDIAFTAPQQPAAYEYL